MLYVYYSKNFLLLAINFSHFSGIVRILRWKNLASFEAIHESIQLLTFSGITSAGQPGYDPWIKTGNSPMEQRLENMTGGVALSI